MSLSIVILAAGKGSRMCSKKPKVLHKLSGKTMLNHVIDTAKFISNNIIVVCGYGSDEVINSVSDKSIIFVKQKNLLGTGHAVMSVLSYLSNNNKVLILYGDVPLISESSLNKLIDNTNVDNISMLSAYVNNPDGFGRIIRNDNNEVEKIIEDKDATIQEKEIKEINTGIFCVYVKYLKKWLYQIDNKNAQNEYYLTDIIYFAKQDNFQINVFYPLSNDEILGVNNRIQLSKLERKIQKSIAEKLMLNGTTLYDCNRFDVRGEIISGSDTTIDVNVIIYGKVKIGNNCIIESNCILKNCTIDNNVIIKSNTIIDGSYIGCGSIIGPFARLRPNNILSHNVKIGNFVEIKESNIGCYSKINHLSYIGDSEIGNNCNVGAGVITCNFDGLNKYKTKIGNNVFIGSDVQLIAPVCLEDNSTIGAGSTITDNIESDVLALSRSPLKKIKNWTRSKKI